MEMDSKEKVKAAFDRSANKFDEVGPQYFRYFGELLASAAGIHPDDSVLDIACGKGAVTFPIAKMLSDTGRVTGIDISEPMIENCHNSLKNLPLRNIGFKVMDAENLEFPNATFDVVTSGFGLFFLSDIAKGFSEIKRVLKPEGTLTFTSWQKPYQTELLQEILEKVIPGQIENPKAQSGKLTFEDFRTEKGLNEMLQSVGLQKISITTETYLCKYRDEEEWLQSRWNTWNRSHLERIPAVDMPKLNSALVDVLSRYRTADGIAIPVSAFVSKVKLPLG
jgi:ubiquinone/menaquinone biosynthesis C-methylase UbiE